VTTTTYTLHINKTQAQTLAMACEVLARLGMGQFRDALEHLPRATPIDYDLWHRDMEAMSAMLCRHMVSGVDGWRSSLGIYHQQIDPTAQVAWDLYAVIRHRLAWDGAVVAGTVSSIDAARQWPSMMGVCFDRPDHVADGVPLAKISAG
jgi:hypothetical protein